MKNFYVVHTKSKQEKKAVRNLEFQGFGTWLPLYKKTIIRKTLLIERIEPFFPGYLFVAFDFNNDNWSKIHSTFGVKYLVSFNGVPKALESSTILMLKKIISNHHLKIDDNVKVLCGKLSNKKGKIIEFCPADRVKLLLESLSGRITAILDKKTLCKI